jgi:sigma-E factor negative regulatory protein RseA
MSTARPSPHDDPRSRLCADLSAAADGDASALAAACQAWRSGEHEARSTWHTYHLIGDVMRSAELAQRPARDEAFLQGLRQRLAQEPVVLAPAPAAATAPPRAMPRWWLPAAAAAGFVAVAGVVVVLQASPGAPGGSPQWAAAPAAPAPAAVPVATSGAVLIRDERLDEFLRAHQAARGGMGAALPGGAIRRVELEAPAPR